MQRAWLIFAVAGMLVLGACVRKTPPPEAPGEVLIGEFSSLSGRQAAFGRAVHKGIQMAVDEANGAGGMNGRKIRLLTYDDRGEPEEVKRLVERLATADGALVIIGEVPTALSLAAAPVAQRLKVPMITPGSTHPAVTQAGDHIFRVCYSDPFQGAVMARFALNYLQFRKAAILLDGSTEYGRALAEYFSREYGASGGSVLARASYKEGQKDFKKELASLLSHRPEILFVPGYFTEAGAIARQARALGFKGVLLGGDGWESARLGELGGKAIEGAYFSDHFSSEDRNPGVREFVGRFRARYQEDPGAVSALGYDAVRVALDGARRAAPLTRAGVREALMGTRNFPGATGIITINKTRDAVKPAVVLRVKGRGSFEYVTTLNP